MAPAWSAVSSSSASASQTSSVTSRCPHADAAIKAVAPSSAWLQSGRSGSLSKRSTSGAFPSPAARRRQPSPSASPPAKGAKKRRRLQRIREGHRLEDGVWPPPRRAAAAAAAHPARLEMQGSRPRPWHNSGPPCPLGAKYFTPEIYTSEIIVDFPWRFPMIIQWHFPQIVTCQWYFPKGCHLSSVFCCWNVPMDFQWHFPMEFHFCDFWCEIFCPDPCRPLLRRAAAPPPGARPESQGSRQLRHSGPPYPSRPLPHRAAAPCPGARLETQGLRPWQHLGPPCPCRPLPRRAAT